MTLLRFPDPRLASPEGIVAIGGRPTTANLLNAYQQGIFPWPIEGWPLPWFCPPERAVLEFKDLHIPRRLTRFRKGAPFTFTIDQDFSGVIRGCADAARPNEDGTWINAEMIRAYTEMHRAGHAHSVEAWENGELVGGMYGVDAGGAFAGESMYFTRPNASKLALLHLIEHLAARGLDWLDIQVTTPHMETLGARVISRDAFLDKLEDTLQRKLRLFDKRE
ncbi:MAG: leucyl/phenylalanyl-tRNA--protein transferase [Acidobacteriota bacterium]|nr:leucyl/phenylalanyl-tRNA--protein transferase [Acidobacteriota bacterium]